HGVRRATQHHSNGWDRWRRPEYSAADDGGAAGRLELLLQVDPVGLQEGNRVDLPPVLVDLEMQVVSGRVTGTADVADHIARLDLVTDAGLQCRRVTVDGLDAAAVVDHDSVAVVVPELGQGDHAVGRGQNGGTPAAGQVDAPVHHAPPHGEVGGDDVRALQGQQPHDGSRLPVADGRTAALGAGGHVGRVQPVHAADQADGRV